MARRQNSMRLAASSALGRDRRGDSRLDYTPAEMMTAVAARELRDGEVVFVGIGLPNLACNLARATHAPNLVLIYESGAVGAVPERLPVSIGDPALVTGSLMVCSMADVFQCSAPEWPDRGRLSRWRADRPLRQHQHHRGGRLRPPGSASARQRRRGGDCHPRPANRGDQPAGPAGLSGAGGLRHQPGSSRARAGAGGSWACPAPGPPRVVTDKAILEADPRDGRAGALALSTPALRPPRWRRRSAGRSGAGAS